MGVAYQYVEDADLIVTIWDGRVTSAEWTDLTRRQATDANFARARRRLADARTADVSSITDDALEISAIYQPADTNVGDVRLAIVTNYSRELAKRTEHSRDARDVTAIVFNSIHTATAWLDVDIDIVSAAIRDLRDDLPDNR
jgi:hypothetical protein